MLPVSVTMDAPHHMKRLTIAEMLRCFFYARTRYGYSIPRTPLLSYNARLIGIIP